MNSSIESKAAKRQQALYRDFFVDVCELHQNLDVFDEKNGETLNLFFESYYPGSTFDLEFGCGFSDDDDEPLKRATHIRWINPHLSYHKTSDRNLLANKMMEMFLSPFDSIFDVSEYSKMTLGMKVDITVIENETLDKSKLRSRKITPDEVERFKQWVVKEKLSNIETPEVINDCLVDFWRKN